MNTCDKKRHVEAQKGACVQICVLACVQICVHRFAFAANLFGVIRRDASGVGWRSEALIKCVVNTRDDVLMSNDALGNILDFCEIRKNSLEDEVMRRNLIDQI